MVGHCPWVLVWTGVCYWHGVGEFIFSSSSSTIGLVHSNQVFWKLCANCPMLFMCARKVFGLLSAAGLGSCQWHIKRPAPRPSGPTVRQWPRCRPDAHRARPQSPIGRTPGASPGLTRPRTRRQRPWGPNSHHNKYHSRGCSKLCAMTMMYVEKKHAQKKARFLQREGEVG